VSLWNKLRGVVGGKDEPPDLPRVLLPRPIFEQTVREHMDSALKERGFHVVTKTRWARSNGPQILAMVELQALKAAYAAVWGLSLEFVPHLDERNGFRVEWHKTEKKARFDLSYNPMDYERDLRPWTVDQLTRPESLPGEALEFADRVSMSAAEYLDPLRTIEATLAAFELKRRRPSIRLGFEHYPQENLAYAFVLARCGRDQEAEQALRQFDASIRQFDDCKDMPASALVELRELLGQKSG
jgi:hypothetical protein